MARRVSEARAPSPGPAALCPGLHVAPPPPPLGPAGSPRPVGNEQPVASPSPLGRNETRARTEEDLEIPRP